MGITVLQIDITVRNRITSEEPPDTALSSSRSTRYGTFNITFFTIYIADNKNKESGIQKSVRNAQEKTG